MPGRTLESDLAQVVRIANQLGQVRPTDTAVTTLYKPKGGTKGSVLMIVVAEVAGGAATYRIFNDKDGTTGDETTALAFNISLSANTEDIQSFDPLGVIVDGDDGGAVLVRSSVGSAITFTAYGIEVSR